MNDTDKIMNEDGTEYDPPVSLEYKALREKYPTCKSIGYKCMYCSDCPCGEYFYNHISEEELKIIADHSDAVTRYIKEHNPSGNGPIIPFKINDSHEEDIINA